MATESEDEPAPMTPEQEIKLAKIRRFYKEMGPLIGELYRASLLDDESFGDSLPPLKTKN
jgi:hypothetical protein